MKAAGKTEIVLTGGDVVTAHDPATGKELWRSSGLNPTSDPWYRIVASPLAVDGLVIAPTRRKPMLALTAGGRGDVTASHRVWSYDAGPDVPTPATDGTYLYVLDDKGIVSCLDVKTGQVLYGPQRIAVGTYSASPVVADGKVYAVSEDGLTWHKHPNNPVLSPDPSRAWESHYVTSESVMRMPDGSFRMWYASRKAPPFTNLYFALNTAGWAGPAAQSK